MDRIKLAQQLRKEGIFDDSVLSAMARVPRELFVSRQARRQAYEDRPLPIGEGQTISQPYMVALMTQTLRPEAHMRVLEVGTGSAYQAAILAELCSHVVTVERVKSLADAAAKLLDVLGYDNVEVHHVCSDLGWLEKAPYDGIMVTAGSPMVPEGLLAQLVEGGRMVIPVGSMSLQSLQLVVKSQGRARVTNLGACRFVPLIGEDAWPKDGG